MCLKGRGEEMEKGKAHIELLKPHLDSKQSDVKLTLC